MADLFEVTLAAGTQDGDELTIDLPDGRSVVVTVPPGQAAHPTMLVEVPPSLRVTVPTGISAGDTFLVEAPDSRFFSVECPIGNGEGDDIDIELPCTGAVDNNSARAAAPAAATTAPHAIGQRVKVLRTNGSWTPATIVDADECSGTFTVRLDQGGALKYFVEASDLAEMDYTPKSAGEHYEGRRVQVCVEGNDKPLRGESWPMWEDAVIRRYDAQTRTYTCELDRGGAEGGTRHGLRATDIRVRQRV